jgi:hypothetical protein
MGKQRWHEGLVSDPVLASWPLFARFPDSRLKGTDW